MLLTPCADLLKELRATHPWTDVQWFYCVLILISFKAHDGPVFHGPM